jgi:hypothetical protein
MPSSDREDVPVHLQQVGFLCAQWAYLELLLEIAIWWSLDHSPIDGRTITKSMPMSVLAREARDNAHQKLTNKSELDAMADVAMRVAAVIDERNLAVHGVRVVQPDETVMASVARGKYGNTLQPMSLDSLQRLNDEVTSIIDVIEPLLHRHGMITGSGERAG